MEISHKRDVKTALKGQFTTIEENAKLRVICGPMFSGKTTKLINIIHTYAAQDRRIQVFKPQLDHRYATKEIVSHDNKSIAAIGITNAEELYAFADKTDVFAIDEAQFFGDEIVNVCQSLTRKNKIVIISGLDFDFKARPFGSMPALLSLADEIIKLNAVCNFCAGHASFSHRTTTEVETLVLGEKDKYVPLCRSCYLEVLKA
ncbi:thymidine kinase [Putridiphycobacter roseus]|uniref:Thymidine kinase n=1 Tax=Putridiphycobacter roseus TaxID=2219161 RepID=A0A2W1MWD3_9FLAO|nr:thymidine kinase [Putridiphycobacter roseus]PZE15694.1 thymidine kinase [Putridiphycobacter roseus]